MKDKKQDISDIIRDAIKSGRTKRKQLPKKVNPTAKRRSRADFPNPMVEGQKRYPAYNVQPKRPRAEFPEPMVEGQKRYPAYNVQPIRPRKNTRPPRQITDDAKRTMPKRKPKPSGIPKKKKSY